MESFLGNLHSLYEVVVLPKDKDLQIKRELITNTSLRILYLQRNRTYVFRNT